MATRYPRRFCTTKRLQITCISAFVVIVLFDLIRLEYHLPIYQSHNAATSVDPSSSGIASTRPSESFSIFQNLNSNKGNAESELYSFTAPQNIENSAQTINLGESSRTVQTRGESKLIENSKDTKDQPIIKGKDIPFFWAIPKCGTSTIKLIMSRCLNLRMASSTGQVNYDEYNQLQLVDLGPKRGQFLNVNFGYLPGIRQASEWRMAESGLVDVAVTSYIHEAVTNVLSTSHPARIFTIMRHPIERMISDFHYQKVAQWERTYDANKANLTLLEYASDSRYHVDNWMTRMLANQHNGPVQNQDFIYAKQVLKDKVLILWLEQIDESVERLIHFMGWEDHLPINPTLERKECFDSKLHSTTPANHIDHNSVREESEEWQMLKKINKFDLNLYWYGKDLFDGEQKDLFEMTKKRSVR